MGPGPSVTIVADVMVRFPKLHRPDTRLAEIVSLFEDDHVQLALIVGNDQRLITTIERTDLSPLPKGIPVSRLGRLRGRIIQPWEDLEWAKAVLAQEGRRRLAVVDVHDRLLGLVCLKRDGSGFCSDDGIRRRSLAATRGRRFSSSTVAP